ncbi:MAG: hypothetical protein WCF99_06765 [Chloroflexales bacterium]
MEATYSPQPTPLSNVMQTILHTMRQETQMHVIVHGSPLAVARLQAALEAADPALGTSYATGVMEGDCTSGRVLVCWSLD